MGLYRDSFIIWINWKKLDFFVSPSSIDRNFFGVVFLHREAPAVFRIAHGIKLDEDDSPFTGALRAGTE